MIPIIGDVKLDDVNPRMMSRYYQSLLKVKSRENKLNPISRLVNGGGWVLLSERPRVRIAPRVPKKPENLRIFGLLL